MTYPHWDPASRQAIMPLGSVSSMSPSMSRMTARTMGSGGAPASCNRLDDLLAVKAAVLDEDGAGVHAGQSAAGDKEAGHVGLEGFAVVGGPVPIGERHTCVRHQPRVRAITGQDEHGVRRNLPGALARASGGARALHLVFV